MALTIKERISKCRESAKHVFRHSILDDLLAKHATHSGKRQREEEEVEEEEEATENDTSETSSKTRMVSRKTKLRKKSFGSDIATTGSKMKSKRKVKTRLTKVAKQILFSAPSEAKSDAHKWQNLFVELVEKGMPSNDKLRLDQALVINDEVVNHAFKLGRILEAAYPAVHRDLHSEENNRPRVYSLAAGLIGCIGEQEVLLQTGPVRYYVKKIINGDEVYVQTSPPGQSSMLRSEATGKTLEHKEFRPRWKTDLTMYSKVKVDDAKELWSLRALVEAKGNNATVVDLFQASSAALKIQLKRYQDNDYVDRLYVEVWGTNSYFYGIHDIFGYVSVNNGVVTKESVDLYLKRVKRQRTRFNFPVDSLLRCPQTLHQFQKLYDTKAQEFLTKYHCELPSLHGREDFPVGVVYFSDEVRLMPLGTHSNNREECVFVQGHLTILGSSSIVTGDGCNEKLLQNYKAYEEKALQKVEPNEPAPPEAEVEVYKIVEHPTEHTFRLGEHWVEPVPLKTIISSSATVSSATVSGTGASKEEVSRWTTLDLSDFLSQICGTRYKSVVKESGMDGALVLFMSDGELNEWLRSLDVILRDRLRVRMWFRELK